MFDESQVLIPDYYLIDLGSDRIISQMDLAEALDYNFNMGCALKYMVRAGKKPDQPRAKDIRKAIRCLIRELQREESLNGSHGTGPDEEATTHRTLSAGEREADSLRHHHDVEGLDGPAPRHDEPS